jgi:ribosomal protein S18 acetylase RimI-like enzyme
MHEITIRKANAIDLPTLFHFEQGVIEAERPFDATLRDDSLFHYYDLEQMLDAPHVQVMVAELQGELIGSGYARIETSKSYLKHAQHAYLGFMYISPQHRGKNVNRKIIEALKVWAISKNIQEFRLEVYAENVSAIKAYQKVGFQKHMIEMRMNVSDVPLTPGE